MSRGLEVGGTQHRGGAAGGPLGEQVGTHGAPVGKLVLEASEAGRKHLRSPPAVGSLAPQAPCPSPSRTLATENLRPFGTVAVWRRSPTQTNFHVGSPPQGRDQGSGWPRVRAGPSVAKGDRRRRHPARGLAPGDHVDSAASTGPGTLQAAPKWSLVVCGCRAALSLASVPCWDARGQGSSGPEQAEGALAAGGAHRLRAPGWDMHMPPVISVLCSPLELGLFGANDSTGHRPGQWWPHSEWLGPS